MMLTQERLESPKERGDILKGIQRKKTKKQPAGRVSQILLKAIGKENLSLIRQMLKVNLVQKVSLIKKKSFSSTSDAGANNKPLE